MRSAVVGVVLLLAVLSGCSDSGAAPAQVEPLASVSASAAGATPGPSPAEGTEGAGATETIQHGDGPGKQPMPSAATVADSAGASSFARHYLVTLQTALATGDARSLEALSDPGCGGCRNLLAAIAEAAEAGHRVRGGELDIVFAEAPQVQDGETIVDLRYQRRAGELVNADGETVERISAEGPTDTQLRVRYAGKTWSVLGFRQVS